MPRYALRTRIKNDIIAEFVFPAKRTNKVIILCGGMPAYPEKKELMFFLADRGYWVFSPRYRGSWESDGWFLKRSPHEDVIDVIDALPKGFTELWNNKRYRIENPRVHLIGNSFGGPAAILASKNKRVEKAVALSSVIDWEAEWHGTAEPMDWLGKFTKAAFGNGYRFKDADWKKLKSGKFYNPISEVRRLDGKKLYLIHAKDDDVVPAELAVRFARELSCKLTILKQGGHLSLSGLLQPAFWRRVRDFLRSR